MGKYIIELPENTHWIQWVMEGTKDHHPYMDYKQVEDLTPYTEDSAYAHGYTEAESKYREIRDELEKQAYQKGLKDAWEAARKIGGMDSSEQIRLFTCSGIYFIAHEYSASECIEKIRQYEQEKGKIQVGDEVEIKCGVSPAIYMQGTNGSDEIYLLFNDGSCGIHSRSEIKCKTGRHFPELVEVLRKMKETDNG